jgi:D-psicose/D-tagatose/L-ribulose 3-epimerase
MKKLAFASCFFAAAVSLLDIGCAGPAAAPGPAPAFRFGVAAYPDVDPLAHVEALAAAGFDYLEPSLSKTAAMGDAEFAAAKRRIEATRIRAEAMNWFVPGEVKLTGPDADPAAIRAYLEKALARAEALGAKAIVFGSPGARTPPPGFPLDRARGQLKDFLRLCTRVIDERGYGMTVCLEPLHTKFTTLINTTAEGVALVREVDHPRIRLTLDIHHWGVMNDPVGAIREAGPWIGHVHFSAVPVERPFPRDAGEDPRYAAFFAALRETGYRGRISLEGNTKDLPGDAARGLAVLRALAGNN